jgi:hypothetical protein
MSSTFQYLVPLNAPRSGTIRTSGPASSALAERNPRGANAVVNGLCRRLALESVSSEQN